MNSTRIYAIFLRQLFLLRNNYTRYANLFVWILLDVVMWGFVTKYLNAVGQADFSFVPVFLGAVVLWNFMIRVQQGVMIAFFEDVWSRNFLNFFASPLTTGEYITGLVVTSIVTASAGLLAMMVFAGAAFGFTIFQFGIFLLPFLLILFLFGLALGVFTAALVLRLGPAAEWIAWPLPFFLSPFAGVFYPISVLPETMQFISSIVPPSYVFEGMRAIIFSGKIVPEHLFFGALLSLIYLFLSYLLFKYVYRYVIRNGHLTRFSAEGGD